MDPAPEGLEEAVSDTGSGAVIRIYVKPGSKREGLSLEYGELVFHTSEPPVRGRANASLLRYLSRVLGVSSGRVAIIRGEKSRLKIVEVSGVSKRQVIEALEKELDIASGRR